MSLEALAAFGTVDLLYTGEAQGWSASTPAGALSGSVWEAPVARARLGLFPRARWLVSPNLPIQALEWADHRPPVLPGAPYDVIWYFRAISYALMKNLPARARVVDLDDLEDHKLQIARGLGRRRSLRRRLAERRNAVAWRRYQYTIARHVDAVMVCSQDDQRKLAVSNCYVVPNGFPRVEQVTSASTRPPTILLVGLFEYGPNGDAARFFVKDVFPSIRAAIPDAALRLVGPDSPGVRQLCGEGVTIVGAVADLAPEYERASVAIAPVRYGSGTRIKILEAFARGVPVVSTTIGADGLGTQHGEHLLLADDAASFAEACLSVIRDHQLRARLVASAFKLYEKRFGHSAVTAAVQQVLVGIGHAGAEIGLPATSSGTA